MLKKLMMWSLFLCLPAHAVIALGQVNLAGLKVVSSANARVEKLYKLGPKVLGAEWRQLTKTRESAIFIYNEGTLSEEGIATVRVGIEYAHPQGPARYMSSRDMYQIDCKARKLAVSEILKFKEHFGDGDLIDSYFNDGFVLQEHGPNTVGYALVSRVCDHGTKI
jgi:hypothetical protein